MVTGLEYAPAVESWSCAALPVSMANRVVQKNGFVLVEGAHTGYASLGVTVSRRILVLGEDALVICDDFIGMKPNTVTQRFHFGEQIQLQQNENCVLGRGEFSQFDMYTYADGDVQAVQIEKSLFSRHYNQLSECPAADLTAEGATSLTTILVRTTNQQAEVKSVPVVNHSYPHTLTQKEAEGYVISVGNHRYGVVLLHQDVGNNADLNGFDGVYGLGRTMACDFNKHPEYMTILQW